MIPSGDTASAGEYVNLTFKCFRVPGLDQSQNVHDDVLTGVQGDTYVFPVSDVVVDSGNDLAYYASVTVRVTQVADGQLYGTVLAGLQSFQPQFLGLSFTLSDSEYAQSSVDNTGADTSAAKSTSLATDISSVVPTGANVASSLTALAWIAGIGIGTFILFQAGAFSWLKAIPRPSV